jgi:hypothetical protein
LNRRETKIRDLQAQYDDLNAKDATLDQDVKTRWREVREVRGLRQHNDDASDQIHRLTYSAAQELTTKWWNRRSELRFAPTPILFQMKLMKVNCNMKSNMNKEFEHDEESILI